MVTIYKLYCINTGEAYIGCTSGKLGKRMREHRCLLNKKRHSARRMQELWNEHGSEGFRLESIEALPKTATVIDKRKREVFWMEHYDKQGMLLNHTKASFGPPDGAQDKAQKEWARIRKETNWKQSDESNKARRLAQLGKPKGHGAKISAAKKGVKGRTQPCPVCGREIYISNLQRHVEPCKRKSGNDIFSSAIK